jgi:hypothetical protein
MIISFLHIIFYIGLVISPFINNYKYKTISYVIITFILAHFITRNGKCGIISIERFFLKDNFKEGFFYKLIKPIICYKINPIYNYYFIYIIYFLILYYQLATQFWI